MAVQDSVSVCGVKTASYPSTLDGGDDHILSHLHHYLLWFAGCACSFELVDDLVTSHLLLGICVDELLEHLVA